MLLIFFILENVETLADEKVEIAKPVVVPVNVNKWDGEDEDEIKVSGWHAPSVQNCILYDVPSSWRMTGFLTSSAHRE